MFVLAPEVAPSSEPDRVSPSEPRQLLEMLRLRGQALTPGIALASLPREEPLLTWREVREKVTAGP